MGIDLAKGIIDEIKKNFRDFDSHQFILELIKRDAVTYGNLLVKHGNVTTAHAEIAKFLKNNCAALGIIYDGDTSTNNIFGTPSKCAQWKIN